MVETPWSRATAMRNCQVAIHGSFQTWKRNQKFPSHSCATHAIFNLVVIRPFIPTSRFRSLSPCCFGTISKLASFAHGTPPPTTPQRTLSPEYSVGGRNPDEELTSDSNKFFELHFQRSFAIVSLSAGIGLYSACALIELIIPIRDFPTVCVGCLNPFLEMNFRSEAIAADHRGGPQQK